MENSEKNTKKITDNNSNERDQLLDHPVYQQNQPPPMMVPDGIPVMNPYGRGQPFPDFQLPIRPIKYKCPNRENWVQKQGKGFVEILQDETEPTICIPPAYSYKIFAHNQEIGKFWEKSDDCTRCCWAPRARTMESHLQIQGEYYIGKKPLKWGYCPWTMCCVGCDSQLPQVNIFKDGKQVAFVVSSFWPNCACGFPHWECYRGDRRDPEKLMFVISNYMCPCRCECSNCGQCCKQCWCGCSCDGGCGNCCFNWCWKTGKMNVWGRDYSVCGNHATPLDKPQIWKEYNGWRCCKMVPSKWQVKLPDGDLDQQATFIIAMHALDMLFKIK